MVELWGRLLYRLYRIEHHRVRGVIRGLVCRLERGEMYSSTLRRIFRDYHSVDIGMYTHGGCFVPGSIDRFTRIGRYCSIAAGVRAFNRDHPIDFKSQHAFFFNHRLGYCSRDLVDYVPLEIGNDVWIGYGAVIQSNVRAIGDGAIVGAGSVVAKDVPPYAVVVGNPARVVRYRFSKEVIEELLALQWWEKDIDVIQPIIEEFQQPFERLFKVLYSGQEDHEKPEEEKETVLTGAGQILQDEV